MALRRYPFRIINSSSSSKDNLDRFIPNRSAMDFGYAHYMLTEGTKVRKEGKENPVEISTYQKKLAEACDIPTRILAFKNKPPAPKETCSPPPPLAPHQARSSKPKRHIPKTRERTLDAPNMVDDFCLNVLDWGSSNVISIALENSVYLWDASNSSTSELVTVDNEDGPVTSVSWAPDGRHLAVGQQLASGGNDNVVHIWDRSVVSSNSPTCCLHRFEEHSAAVKGLAWCPFQSNLLVSGGGGGVGDNCIKMWNTHTGARLNSVDTGSQVCALLWNKNERELLSSHGFTENQLTLWKYPSMVKMAELNGHTSRVLHMTQSPDGCTVATAAADETLMLWNVFGTPAEACKAEPKTNLEPFANLNRIR
ncbi:hypothetical protein TSUD_173990 [Trifolium subterraneum]|nr:hypothetical protein TSUD_173990 [Trifolium subterraneum]